VTGSEHWKKGTVPLSARRRLGRQALRLVVLVLVLALLALEGQHVGWWRLPGALSPLVGLASALALRAVTLTTLLALPVLVLVFVWPRSFCRYLCPTGLLADGAGQLCPWRRRSRHVRLPAIGMWVAVMTLAGTCFGYPLLAWMDPLVLLTAAVDNLSQLPPSRVALLSAAGLPLVLAISFLLPGAWCTRLCPLGALQDLVALPRRRNLKRTTGWRIARRSLLAAGAGVAGAIVARRSAGASVQPLRPPGAVLGNRFTGLCVRCGNCARACPASIIQPDLGSGLVSLLTPFVRFDTDYCRENCHACGDVCPSGAIAVSKPPATKPSMGVARVNAELCLLSEDRECSACRSHCPYEAIRYVFSEKEYMLTVVIDPQRCPGCGACQVACPASPEKAIVVVPVAPTTAATNH
jgi:ferredoxin-type protein NapF